MRIASDKTCSCLLPTKRENQKWDPNSFLEEFCPSSFRQSAIVDAMLKPVLEARSLHFSNSDLMHVQVINNTCLASTVWTGVSKVMASYLCHQILPLVNLPDFEFYLSPFDDPVNIPAVFSFCRRTNDIDMLLPYSYWCCMKHEIPWEAKTNSFVWIGTPNGGGKKERFNVMSLTKKYPSLVHAGWSWPKNSEYYVEGMTLEEQQKYKYVGWLPGNCASVRFLMLLSGNSVVYKADSDEVEWYYSLFKPWVHYVPFSAFSADEEEDSLISRIKWGMEHDSELKEITKRANLVARSISARQTFCYTAELFIRYANETAHAMNQPHQHQVVRSIDLEQWNTVIPCNCGGDDIRNVNEFTDEPISDLSLGHMAGIEY